MLPSIKLVVLFMLLALTCCCPEEECDFGSGYFNFRLVRDGKNAVFGPDAFISKDDIRHLSDKGIAFEEEYLHFDESQQTIELYLITDLPSFLEIKNISFDTITITSQLISKECGCDHYGVNAVWKNGEVLCEGACDDPIEIEI